jgi:hypothetical protein
MGLDLRLLPSYGLKAIDFSNDVISLDRDYILFDAFQKIPDINYGRNLEGLSCFLSTIPSGELEGEHCFGKVIKDKYDNSISYLKNKDIIQVLGKYLHTLSWKNKAVYSYLKECPEDLIIYLYWC